MNLELFSLNCVVPTLSNSVQSDTYPHGPVWYDLCTPYTVKSVRLGNLNLKIVSCTTLKAL